jgi:hypothetical protein
MIKFNIEFIYTYGLFLLFSNVKKPTPNPSTRRGILRTFCIVMPLHRYCTNCFA